MILISDAEVKAHVGWADLIAAIERCFLGLARGHAEVFDVVRARGGGADHFFAIKSGRDSSIPALGLKAGSYAPGNTVRGLPAHTSTTLLIDDLTGRPFAVVEANYLNGMRTAAADALAVRALAREDSEVLGLIGCGEQAAFEAAAIHHVRPMKRILAASRSAATRSSFAARVEAELGLPVHFETPERVVRGADVVVTVTPSRAPLVDSGWVRPGTHVSAMGADDVGKQELDPRLFTRARTFVDSPVQAVRIGECQHPVRLGLLAREALERCTLGAVLAGEAAGRLHPEDITVFDSSGLAVQDIAAAYCAVQAVERAGTP